MRLNVGLRMASLTVYTQSSNEYPASHEKKNNRRFVTEPAEAILRTCLANAFGRAFYRRKTGLPIEREGEGE
jgi:hypothetical protein